MTAQATQGRREATCWTLDAEGCTLRFEVGFLFGLTRVRGEFRRMRGWARLNAAGKLEELEVTVDAGSLSTGIARRDAHLLSRDFLDAERHPVLTFRSVTVTPMGEGHWQVEGDLTLRGITATAGFAVLASPVREGRLTVMVRGILQRRSWGVTFGLPLIGADVWYEGTLAVQADG